MSIFRIFTIGPVLLIASLSLISCSGKTPSNLGVSDSGLAPCPASPNCLSSDAHDSAHQTPPFQIDGDPDEAWAVVREIVAALSRTRIVNEAPEYLHAECRSSVFRFVDDLELHLRPSDGIIAVRSASRLGHSDFGVNQRRIDTLRAALISRGVIR
ncbi:MAG: DUF1499 domain-containing protein [Desulfuromusa sp.]|nr:DUF1499 domain-containing protein [Desulfuromusa sp.]